MARANDSPEKKEKAAKYMKAYYHSHPEYKAAVIARNRARELANPEGKKEADKLYRERHHEAINKRIAAAQRERRTRPEVLARDRAYLKEWRIKNKHKTAANHRAWKENNRVKIALQERARQAKSKTVINPLDIYNWETRLCGICSLLIEDKFHIDHKIPLSKGGLHEISNLQLAHPNCNLRKGDKLYFTI